MLNKILLFTSICFTFARAINPCRYLQDIQSADYQSFQVKVDNQTTQISKLNVTTTLEEIRTQTLTTVVNKQEYFFFYNGCVVQQNLESETTISEIVQHNSSVQTVSQYLELRKGEQYYIEMMNQTQKTVYAYDECTLHQFRNIAGLSNDTYFVWANLNITVDLRSELNIQVKDVVGGNNTLITRVLASANASANVNVNINGTQVNVTANATGNASAQINQVNKTDMLNATKDQFGNPIGSQFDLGKDNAFTNYTLLIGCFYLGEGICNDIQNNTVIPALSVKGINTTLVNYEDDFIAQLELNETNEAWIISSYQFNRGNETEFINKTLDFLYQRKGGLMIWADNDPFFYHANLLLPEISLGQYNGTDIHINLTGNYPGQQTLSLGNVSEAGYFGSYQITTGLNSLYEGITICEPEVISDTPSDNYGNLTTIAMSSGGYPAIMALNQADEGRMIIDCGFTKLMSQYWNLTAGTARYVQNSAVWLLFNNTELDNTF